MESKNLHAMCNERYAGNKHLCRGCFSINGKELLATIIPLVDLVTVIGDNLYV